MTGDELIRLSFDATRCVGHGICALRFDKIALDQWGYAVVEPGPLESRRDRRKARRAVAACPEGALRIVAVRRQRAENEPMASRGSRR